MFNFFSKEKRFAGIQVTSEAIRFVEVLRMKNFDRITSYGEVMPDGEFMSGEIVKDRNAFLTYLKDIKKNLKTGDVAVTIPNGSDKDEFFNLFNKVNIKVRAFVPAGEALARTCVPHEAGTSFLIINADEKETSFAAFDPSGKLFNYMGDSATHSIISNLNHIFIDWYDKYKERLNHVLIAGARATDTEFVDYISRETKIHIARANIFVNLDLHGGTVPIITKEDSYKYAIALGLAIS